MRIKKSLRKLAAALAVTGILLVGCQTSYAEPDVNEKIAAIEEKISKLETDNANSAKIAANEVNLSKLEADNGFNNLLACGGLGVGVLGVLCSIGLLFKCDNYANKKDFNELKTKYNSSKNELEKIKGQVDYLEKLIDTVSKNEAAHQQEAELMRAAKAELTAREPIRKAQPPKPSPPPQQAINKAKLLELQKKYQELMRLWSMDKSAFRIQRKAFLQQEKIEEFSCINSSQRVSGNFSPVYGTVTNGIFWAIPMPNTPRMFFAFPSPTLTYEKQVHYTGGMQEAFVSNFQDSVAYSSFMVDEPAFFEKTADKWKLAKKGKLSLK